MISRSNYNTWVAGFVTDKKASDTISNSSVTHLTPCKIKKLCHESGVTDTFAIICHGEGSVGVAAPTLLYIYYYLLHLYICYKI